MKVHIVLRRTITYENNYQYDIFGWGVSVAADDFADGTFTSKTGYTSSIFTAESDEQLEAVSFYTTDVNASYEISVYTGVDEDNPTSGKKVLEGISGTEFYAGYHTIELDRPIKLNGGENDYTPIFPSGYKAADDTKYTVSITRDDSGELKASVSEITVKVVSSALYGDANFDAQNHNSA